MKFFLLLSGLVAASFIFAAAVNAQPAPQQHVVLMSLDGFRHDYIEKHDAGNLARIADEGVRAAGLIPVYPANTFPNHLSIVTGVYPTAHGIVNNRFYDKQRVKKNGYAAYSLGKGKQDSSWINALPLWNLVEFHGKKAGSFFWPEADARINGAVPTYHYHYNKYASYQQRVDQIVQWLSLPDASRPVFVAGYFSLTDTVGHDYGPDAPETKAAVQRVDALVGELYDRLQALPVPVNLIIVADHGMTSVDEERLITAESLGIDESFVYENEGAQIMVYARPGVPPQAVEEEATRLRALADGRFTVLSDTERAERHFQRGPRTGDIVLEIAPPARFIDADHTFSSPGGHGYLPSHPDMAATFVAAGPAFKKGARLPALSALEIYPGIAHLLGLPLLSETVSDGAVFKQGLSEKIAGAE
ncbi:ectonucleotide pyrophosphatase/phosphodiesterase [Alteromonas sp. ASW11-19]|uniref:Ectonucleotide pyrophosphatase/phosphodiesterase n=1 Tax=Alteromonas salexigens TaxID=2982530 RepID=A0ABT2VIT4_9ALTE|nr:ectonucleotide pyrophosphatase/phosphodiesterase [Alteromonas salexigens]MCU7553075.1 ectonucleotide pyrophosphatase/phosphodiesterase [Alteromonas salexigens]